MMLFIHLHHDVVLHHDIQDMVRVYARPPPGAHSPRQIVAAERIEHILDSFALRQLPGLGHEVLVAVVDRRGIEPAARKAPAKRSPTSASGG